MYVNVLLNGLKGDERKRAEEVILRAQPFMELIKTKIEEETTKEMDVDFDKPSWAYQHAYELGYRHGLTKILKYGNLKPSKE